MRKEAEAGGEDCQPDESQSAARMDQMLWERHLAATEAAAAAAKELSPTGAAALIASYERQAEIWASQGELWAELARGWREIATMLMGTYAAQLEPRTGPG